MNALRFLRRHPVPIGVVVAVLLLFLLFDWNWFRGPLERIATAKLHREVHIAHLDVDPGAEPVVRLQEVTLANAEGGSEPRMARAGGVEVRIALRDLLRGQVYLPRIAVSDADVLLERYKDGRNNWTLVDPNAAAPRQAAQAVRIGGVSLDRGRIRYRDAVLPADADVVVRPVDAQAAAGAQQSQSAPDNGRYATRFDLTGHYRGSGFSGQAATGNVLSLQESGIEFPVRAELAAGTTTLRMEGTIADVAKPSAMDVRLQIAGETMATLYPFLLLPLPASPPYDLHGRLRLAKDRYAIDDLGGRIGSTDVAGSGSYVVRAPRPRLTVHLRSDLLKVADLGPLIGIQTATRPGKMAVTTGSLATREQASRTDKATRGERVLPAGTFDPARLRAIDADVTLDARRLETPVKLPLQSLKATLHLSDAVLKLDPLDVGLAGGHIVSQATLDARAGPALDARLRSQLRGLQLDRLMPGNGTLAKAAGRMGAELDLHGHGNSIAQAAADADGRIALAMADGRWSNLLDAASGLNFGKVLQLLIGGDKDIAVRCGGVVFDVKDGQGRSTLFVVDTAQTQILGSGSFDLDHERFDLHIEPKPKRPGILSLRSPVRVHGSFSKADVDVAKTPLLLRAGGALALGAVAPLAALIPLIETGPGQQTACGEVLAQAAEPNSATGIAK